MRIWQKTLLNSPVSFYGIEIPFRHAEKPTGFLQPALLFLIFLLHIQIIQRIQPHLHLPVKHHPHILHRVLDSQCIHLPLGVRSGPKTLLPFPTIKTYDMVSIIVNHIYRIILLVVKSSYHSHDHPPAFLYRISVAMSTSLLSGSPVASAFNISATCFCLFG